MSHRGDSSTARHDEMNLLSSLGNWQVVVAHGDLAGEESTVNAGQNNGTFSTRDTDNTVLMGDEPAGLHKSSDMTALGTSQPEVSNAHRAVAAADDGKQISVHGVHGAHCRPPAEWTQHLVGALGITGASISLWPPGPSPQSVTDVLIQNRHRSPAI